MARPQTRPAAAIRAAFVALRERAPRLSATEARRRVAEDHRVSVGTVRLCTLDLAPPTRRRTTEGERHSVARALDAIRREHPEWPATAMRREVANAMRLSVSTVRKIELLTRNNEKCGPVTRCRV